MRSGHGDSVGAGTTEPAAEEEEEDDGEGPTERRLGQQLSKASGSELHNLQRARQTPPCSANSTKRPVAIDSVPFHRTGSCCSGSLAISQLGDLWMGRCVWTAELRKA